MRKLYLLTFCSLFNIKMIYAQVPAAMPADANEFYNSSMPILRAPVKNVVLKAAAGMKHRKANADSLSRALKLNAALHGASNNDIDGIVVLIMVQASKNADADLKNMVMSISHEKEQKKSENKDASADETAGIQNVKLQMIMNHKSDMAEEVSYLMPKISADQQSIINNLK